MGLLDFFGNKAEKQLKKHAARVGNKRAQNPDRWESIHALGDLRSREAVAALLARFTFRVDPSITDQEEKEATVQAVVKAGEEAVEPLIAFLHSSDSIAWPYKCLEQIVAPEVLTTALLDVLSEMDTEYERDPEKKIQVLSALGERADPRISEAVQPFLEDVNETVRFHTVATLMAQDDVEDRREQLIDQLMVEDSVRVRARIVDGFIARDWSLGERAGEVREKLPTGYVLDAAGQVRRK